MVNSQCQEPVLYLFRHGQTDWSLAGKHTGRTDIALNATGKSQAKSLRKTIEQVKLAAVLVSPLSRARETAELAHANPGATMIMDELAELDYGSYEGLTTAEIRKEIPDWSIWTHSCPAGESLEQAAIRCKKVIEEACTIGGNVAIFSHGHLLRILTATWLGMPPAGGKYFILETSTVSVLSHERENRAIMLWNSPVKTEAAEALQVDNGMTSESWGSLRRQADAAINEKNAELSENLYDHLLAQLKLIIGDNEKELAAELQRMAGELEAEGRKEDAFDFKQRTCAVLLKMSMSTRHRKIQVG